MTDNVKYLRDMADEIEKRNPNIPHDWSYLKVQGEIMALQEQINELKQQSGLMSRSWFTRAITAWLYIWGIQLIAGLIILVLGMIFGLLS